MPAAILLMRASEGKLKRAADRLALAIASRSFTAMGAILATAALCRSRSILQLRTWRAHLASIAASIQWKAPPRPALRLAEATLWILAASTLGYCTYAYTSAAIHQHDEKARFSEIKAHAAEQPSFAGIEAPPDRPSPGQMLGILDIPRIGLSSIVEQGADARVLGESVGHVPGTAMPGEPGNTALAAHRDTYFRHLSELRPGDKILYQSISHTYSYTVRSTRIVKPTDTAVLTATQQPTLTLVTCFPFYYIGSAPKRFVLVATEDSPVR